jgi:hypothetical protein
MRSILSIFRTWTPELLTRFLNEGLHQTISADLQLGNNDPAVENLQIWISYPKQIPSATYKVATGPPPGYAEGGFQEI